MYYRIIAISEDGKEAYAERLLDCLPIGGCRVVCTTFDKTIFIAHEEDIIKDPVILYQSRSAEWLFRIKVEG